MDALEGTMGTAGSDDATLSGIDNKRIKVIAENVTCYKGRKR